MAVTSDDRAQTGGKKSIVAIASDTIRVAPSPTPAVNSDTVMLLGRVIEGGGGSIQTWVAATQRRGGGNIATDPAGVNDNGFSILPSIFLIADSPSGAGNFYYGSEFSPIAVSFGGTGTAGNSTLRDHRAVSVPQDGWACGSSADLPEHDQQWWRWTDRYRAGLARPAGGRRAVRRAYGGDRRQDDR
jgi:hypothetical protein